MILPASYQSGFAPRDGQALYPELWKNNRLAISGGLGPTGLIIRDWSPCKDNGSLTDVTATNLWQPSQGRYAMNFGGGNERVLLSRASAVISDASQYSVSLWFNADSLSNSPVLIANIAGSGTGLFNDFFIELASTGNQIYWGNGSGQPFRTYATSNYAAGKWNHIAVVKTATGNNGRLYLNGIEQLSFSGSINTPRVFQGDMAVGYYSTNTTFSFDGKIDDVMFYNIAIEPRIITKLALRRGIAYELSPRRRSSVQVPGFRAAWIPRQRLIIGGGV